MEKITVIVPAYNVEKYISRCIDSILDQTYQNLEIIIVDDGSTDRTDEIIDKYSDEHDNIITVHQPNAGVTSARLKGLATSTGDYIGFVDSDDYIEPEMYERLIGNANKYNADISHCGYKMIYPNGNEVHYYGTGVLKVYDHEAGLYELLEGSLVEPSLSNKLYRRKCFDGLTESCVWDSSIKINEDLLMNYLLFKKAETTVFEDIPFYHYILRTASAATTFSINNVLDPLKVIEAIYKDSIDSNSQYVSVVYERYLRALIRVSTQNNFKDEAAKAKIKLTNEVRKRQRDLPAKVKLMSNMVVYTPTLYKTIRYIYDMIKGNRKKYDIG